MAVDHFAAAVVLVALLFHPFGSAAEACAGAVEATSGFSYKWPHSNPALVAPVTTRFHYDSYKAPLSAEYTGSSLSLKAPIDFVGGFDVADKNGKTVEQYSLHSIEVRMPGKGPQGSTQVLGHALEAALLHKETSGKGYWATVVVPFKAEQQASDDMLTALFGAPGTKLPSETSNAEHALLGGSAFPLDLNTVWQGTTFYEFWVELPLSCDERATEGDTISARQFMRNASVGTTQATLMAVTSALSQSSSGTPMQPSKLAWSVAGCPKGAAECAPLRPADLAPKLLRAQKLQSAAVKNLRTRKSDMDSILVELDKSNTAGGLYQRAVSARDGLKAAQAELQAIMHTVAALTDQQNSAKTAVWDSDAPGAGSTNDTELEPANATLLMQAPAAEKALEVGAKTAVWGSDAPGAGSTSDTKSEPASATSSSSSSLALGLPVQKALLMQAPAAERALEVGAAAAAAGVQARGFLAAASHLAHAGGRHRDRDNVNLIQVGARRFSSASAAGSLKEL